MCIHMCICNDLYIYQSISIKVYTYIMTINNVWSRVLKDSCNPKDPRSYFRMTT